MVQPLMNAVLLNPRDHAEILIPRGCHRDLARNLRSNTRGAPGKTNHIQRARSETMGRLLFSPGTFPVSFQQGSPLPSHLKLGQVLSRIRQTTRLCRLYCFTIGLTVLFQTVSRQVKCKTFRKSRLQGVIPALRRSLTLRTINISITRIPLYFSSAFCN